MQKIKWISTLLAIWFLASCATGPSLKNQSAAIPILEAGKARIFFYRTGIIGAAYQPDILLNGNKVGNAKPRGVFFNDVMPGHYSVTTTMTKETVDFDVLGGDEKFIKLSYSFGFNIYPELVDSAFGKNEAFELSYTGSK